MSLFENNSTIPPVGLIQPAYGTGAPSPGISKNYSRDDHRHIVQSTDVPFRPTFASSADPQPVYSNATTRDGFYCIIGNKCFFNFTWILGVGDTVGTTLFYWNLPINARYSANARMFDGALIYDDNTGIPYLGKFYLISATQALIYIHATGAVASTVPITFTTSDRLHGEGWYSIS
jgi:hypothetical protein